MAVELLSTYSDNSVCRQKELLSKRPTALMDGTKELTHNDAILCRSGHTQSC